MPKKRFVPRTVKHATDKARTAEVWTVYDTSTKQPWSDHRNQVSNWFDVSRACDVLNSREP